jgi:hypothetical protein
LRANGRSRARGLAHHAFALDAGVARGRRSVAAAHARRQARLRINVAPERQLVEGKGSGGTFPSGLRLQLRDKVLLPRQLVVARKLRGLERRHEVTAPAFACVEDALLVALQRRQRRVDLAASAVQLRNAIRAGAAEPRRAPNFLGHRRVNGDVRVPARVGVHRVGWRRDALHPLVVGCTPRAASLVVLRARLLLREPDGFGLRGHLSPLLHEQQVFVGAAGVLPFVEVNVAVGADGGVRGRPAAKPGRSIDNHR